MKIETKRLWGKIIKGLIILVAILFVLVPIGLYFYNFRTSSLSDKGEGWAYFGEYLSPFIALASFIVIGFLTYRLYTLEVNRDIPVLLITRLKPTIDIYNIGNVPAFKIRVITYYNQKDDTIQLFNQLVPNDSKAFSQPEDNATGLVVEYQNVHGKIFKVYPNQDLAEPVFIVIADSELDRLFGVSKLKSWWLKKRNK